MRRRTVLFAVTIIIVLVSSALYVFLSSGGENLLIKDDTTVWTYDEENPNYFIHWSDPNSNLGGNQTLGLHVQNIGSEIAYLYQVEWAGGGWRNWTFSQDIVLPAGVDCIIYIPVRGGPTRFETIKLGSGGNPPSGGKYAFSTNSSHTTGLYGAQLLLRTRSGGSYWGSTKVEFNGTIS